MKIRALAVLILLGMSLCSSNAQQSRGNQTHWWQHAVFYEIYPRSFADSNNDGMGDINGITSKLDYLHSLGVDAIWITPCFPSPQVDFGYDVSDYRDIAPEYGTLKDFDRLLAEAKKRNIRVLLDLVMNHSSDKHAWFVDSRSSRSAEHRDWYIWRDGRGPDRPPNNWESTFGGSAWQFDPTTNQYYYHFFYREQPDLNWRNPKVEQAMFDVARYWFKRGVAGFRLDAVTTLFEDPKLTDNPIEPGMNKFGDPNMEDKYNNRLPEVHDELRRLRKVADEAGDRVLIGETGSDDVAKLSEFYGPNLDELQLAMNFFFMDVNKLSAPEFRKQIAEWDQNPRHGWPVWVLSNHDQVRHYDRYGDGEHNDAIAKLMATMLLTLRGSPIMYYGEEIGMENNDPKRREEVKDPIGKLGWPKEKGRDGERTPMQWDDSANAGFSKAKPWLPVPASYKTHNVASEEKDANSVLNFYKKLLRLRHSTPALLDGEYIPLNQDDANVLAYLRKVEGSAVLVALNMSAEERSPSFDLSAQGLHGKSAKTLLTSGSAPAERNLQKMTLEPFGVFVGEVRQ
jgi:alpha-glucosidase